jgi:hypothetical protein
MSTADPPIGWCRQDAPGFRLPGPAPRRSLGPMARCEVCGNDYVMSFEVHAQGAVHVFDSFECAIHRMAPICEHCMVRIVGHGVEVDGRWYCGGHCAKAEGAAGIVDRVGSLPA